MKKSYPKGESVFRYTDLQNQFMAVWNSYCDCNRPRHYQQPSDEKIIMTSRLLDDGLFRAAIESDFTDNSPPDLVIGEVVWIAEVDVVVNLTDAKESVAKYALVDGISTYDFDDVAYSILTKVLYRKLALLSGKEISNDSHSFDERHRCPTWFQGVEAPADKACQCNDETAIKQLVAFGDETIGELKQKRETLMALLNGEKRKVRDALCH